MSAVAVLHLKAEGTIMSALSDSIDALEAEVGPDANATSAATTLIDKLLADVEANKGSPERVMAVVNAYRTNTADLVAAVLKGTPAEGQPPTP